MPRKADGKGKVRADLEAVLLSLADLGDCVPVVELRITQAIRRGGMDALLVPVLDELKRMTADVCDAQAQVRSAVGRLME